MRPCAPALLVGVALVASGAAAEPDADARRKADEAFQTAKQQLALGQFAAAAASYERAADLVPHPAPLLDAADAWERASDPARAGDDCERALSLIASSHGEDDRRDVDYRRDAEQCLARLSPLLAIVELRGPRTMTARVDSGPPVSVPGRRRLMPGRHVAVATDLETRQTHSVAFDVAAGEARTVDLRPAGRAELEPHTARLVPFDGATGKRVPAAFWVGVGVAGVSAVAGSVFGGLVVSAYDDYKAQPTVDARTRFHRWAAATDVAIGVGVLAVVGSVALWITAPAVPKPNETRRAGEARVRF